MLMPASRDAFIAQNITRQAAAAYVVMASMIEL
jgi:hypothetical protein